MDMESNGHGFYPIAVPLLGEQQKLLGVLSVVGHKVEQNQKLDKQSISQLINTGLRIRQSTATRFETLKSEREHF